MRVTHSVRVGVAAVTIVALFASPIAPLVAAQAPAAPAQAPATPAQAPAGAKPATAPPAAKPASPAPATAKPAAAAAVPTDGGWPRSVTTASGAALIAYQPQISSWTDQKHVVAYSAVSYASKGAEKPALGTVKLEADTSVALDERLVSFSEFKITEPNFPTLQRDQLKTTSRKSSRRCRTTSG